MTILTICFTVLVLLYFHLVRKREQRACLNWFYCCPCDHVWCDETIVDITCPLCGRSDVEYTGETKI